MTERSERGPYPLPRLEEEAEIRALAARFADAVNRRDEKEFRSLWIPSGCWEIRPPMSMAARGIEAIAGAFTGLLDRWDFFVQMVHTGTIEREGDRASARFYLEEIGRSKEGKGFHNYGLYADELTRESGPWLFVRRVYHYAYIEEPALSGRSFRYDLAGSRRAGDG